LHAIVVGQEGHCLFEDRRVVEVALVVEEALVGLEPVEYGAAVELGVVALRFTQNGQCGDVVTRFAIALQCSAVEVGGGSEPALTAVPIEEEALLDFVQDLELQMLRRLGFEQFQTEGVDGADEHLGHSRDLAEGLTGARDDPVLELGGCIVLPGLTLTPRSTLIEHSSDSKTHTRASVVIERCSGRRSEVPCRGTDECRGIAPIAAAEHSVRRGSRSRHVRKVT